MWAPSSPPDRRDKQRLPAGLTSRACYPAPEPPAPEMFANFAKFAMFANFKRFTARILTLESRAPTLAASSSPLSRLRRERG
jgi:hypothetical protein